MTVTVGIVGKAEAVFVLQLKQAGHGIGARRIHSNPAVVIERHEREGWVDHRIGHRDVQLVDFVDCLPVRQRRTAKRVNTELQTRSADRIDINDVRQIIDIGKDKVFRVGCLRLHGG